MNKQKKAHGGSEIYLKQRVKNAFGLVLYTSCLFALALCNRNLKRSGIFVLLFPNSFQVSQQNEIELGKCISKYTVFNARKLARSINLNKQQAGRFQCLLLF